MRYFILIFALVFAGPIHAQDTSDIDARARDVSQSLRCVVCQNQSIDDSDAPLAADMRKLVRQRIEAGDSNAEVIAYMQERYGDYVLLKPPVQGNTYALWFLPFIILAAGSVWFMRNGKRRADTTGDPS